MGAVWWGPPCGYFNGNDRQSLAPSHELFPQCHNRSIVMWPHPECDRCLRDHEIAKPGSVSIVYDRKFVFIFGEDDKWNVGTSNQSGNRILFTA